MCKLKAIPISSCYGCRRQLSTKSFCDELPNSLVEEDEDEELVDAVIRKSVEERRRRKAMYTPYDYSWTFPPVIEKLFVASETLISQAQHKLMFAQDEGADEDGEDDDEFHSATSSLSDGTIATVMKSFSVCHWLECDGNKDVAELWKKQVMLLEELLGCEGWPFGLLRKVVLLPPLPSSPSDSWSWTKPHKK
ncbi:unnamed protein product [Rhodiola kirilowii]